MLDLKEEQKYKRLRELALELHIPVPEVFLTLEVFDKNGKLIQRHHQRSHSWVRNAYNMLFSNLAGKDASDSIYGAGYLNVMDLTGIVRYGARPICLYPTSSVDTLTTYGYREGAGDDTKGIMVGSGINAESFEDYVLQTKITNGVGAGQLNYVESELHSTSYAALVFTNVLVRYFNNNSGGSVDVNEVGIATSGNDGTTRYWLHSRDHLPVTVTVPDTGQLKVTYTIQLPYPA